MIPVLLVFAAWAHAADPAPVEPQPPTAPTPASIFQAAALAMGGETAVAAISTIDATASCVGPTGRKWTMRVASARDGRFLFDQIHEDGGHDAGGYDGKDAWECSAPGTPCTALDAAGRSALQGHEFHMIALAPESRFTGPAAASAGDFEGHAARIVTLHDALGAPVEIFYDAASGLPRGVRLTNHTGRGAESITVVFGRWEKVGPLRLFKRAVIRQGDDTFRFDFDAIELNGVPDAAFVRPMDASSLNR
ncbi:MAG: hypothetical protein HY049_17120 [Acidobacteria bacterium]|nr:hypothetical protein [Acidobacteriota bacterium]